MIHMPEDSVEKELTQDLKRALVDAAMKQSIIDSLAKGIIEQGGEELLEKVNKLFFDSYKAKQTKDAIDAAAKEALNKKKEKVS